MADLKYQNEIDSFGANCDLGQFSPKSREAYRFSTANLEDRINFEPMYQIDSNLQKNKCLGWALSFFDSADQAKSKMEKLCQLKTHTSKKYSHLMHGTISEDDGISSESNPAGHFDHFEYQNVDLIPKFQIISPL